MDASGLASMISCGFADGEALKCLLVRVDQVFLASCLAAVGLEGCQVEGFGERNLGGVATREGRRDFAGDPIPQPACGFESDGAEEGGE